MKVQHILGVLAVAVLLALASSACESESGDGSGGSGGGSCPNVGDYKCEDNIVYLCRMDGWEASQDCSASTTPDCQCAIIEGEVGRCSVGGEATMSATFCEGEFL